jgi:hypothetical protein
MLFRKLKVLKAMEEAMVKRWANPMMILWVWLMQVMALLQLIQSKLLITF